MNTTPLNPSNIKSALQKKRVLVLDDDVLFGKVLAYQLKQSGLSSQFCSSSNELFEQMKTETIIDLFILDYNLGSESVSGLDICRKVKAICSTQVFMLTADTRIETLVSCLSAGADQYIVKPCDIRELTARIDVAFRQHDAQTSINKPKLRIELDGHIKVSITDQTLIRNDGEAIELSRSEMGILELLIGADGGFIDRQRAFKALHGYPMDPSNRCIDLNISRLRAKLRLIGSVYDIKSVRGKGYKLSDNNAGMQQH